MEYGVVEQDALWCFVMYVDSALFLFLQNVLPSLKLQQLQQLYRLNYNHSFFSGFYQLYFCCQVLFRPCPINRITHIGNLQEM